MIGLTYSSFSFLGFSLFFCCNNNKKINNNQKKSLYLNEEMKKL